MRGDDNPGSPSRRWLVTSRSTMPPLKASPPGTPRKGPGLPFLALTAGTCGALVMLLEVLGSRVIGPFFGASLFVWTALISVTLVSLAAGYAAGGVVADRSPRPGILYALVLVSGLLVLLVPLAKGPVLGACSSMGIRAGALAAAGLLFAPPLVLLGTVSPFVVRLAAREASRIGRTVGLLSAISTAGSFLGTLLTGYWLIPAVGVSRIFTYGGGLLVLLGASWFVLFGTRRASAGAAVGIALLAVPVASGLLVPGAATVSTRPDGTRVTQLLRQDTFYGALRVVEYEGAELRTRELVVDGAIQGGVDARTGQSIYEYAYALQWMPRVLHPGGRTALVVGLGAGIVPAWFESQGVRCDVVDIDPAVLAAARSFFGFHVSGEIFLEDGRSHLERSAKRYDYVVLDIFSGDSTPLHLLSREALAAAADRLAPDGVLAVNLIGSTRREPFVAASVVATLRTVLPVVQAYPLFQADEEDGFGNIELFAYRGAERAVPPGSFDGFAVHRLADPRLRSWLSRPFVFPAGTEARVLTDDFNPLDVKGSWVKERVRLGILAATERSVLL